MDDKSLLKEILTQLRSTELLLGKGEKCVICLIMMSLRGWVWNFMKVGMFYKKEIQ